MNDQCYSRSMDSAETLYRQHVKAIHSFFFYREVGLSELEDLVQETFVRYFRRYDQEARASEETAKILYGVARNVWREWVRTQIRTNTLELLEHDLVLTSQENSEGYSDEEIDKLKSALALLQQTQREVLTLRFIEGMTRKEVAEKLGTSESDVHTYQKRGIKALRRILSEPVPPSA